MKTTVIPAEVPYKNVQVDSKVWCNGKKERNLSLLVTFAIQLKEYMSEQIFFWLSITAFEMEVVPEVNIIIDIAVLSIVILPYFLSPLANSLAPLFISFGYDKILSLSSE